MITKLTLTNWKSFKEAQLWVDPLTFIIGMNSAGKSNIIEALEFLSFSANGIKLSEITKNRKIRGEIDSQIRRKEKFASVCADLNIGKYEYHYILSFTYSGKELLINKESLNFNISNVKDSPQILFETLKVNEKNNEIEVSCIKDKKDDYKILKLKRDASILSQIPNLYVTKELKDRVEAVLEVLRNIFVFSPDPDKMRQYVSLSDKLEADGSNIAGVIANLPKVEKEEFERRITTYVKALPEKDIKKIGTLTVGLDKSDAILYSTEEWMDGKTLDFDARAMSDGTLRFIAIITMLLFIKKGSTIVIEEIDNGLHPSRAHELVNVLKNISKERNLDIICTTHNPVLIDALGPQMLPLISYVSRSSLNGSSEIHLLEDAPHLIKLLANYTPGGMMINGKL